MSMPECLRLRLRLRLRLPLPLRLRLRLRLRWRLRWCLRWCLRLRLSLRLSLRQRPRLQLLLWGLIFGMHTGTHLVFAETMTPALGRTLEPAEISALPRHVFADGTGLPPGQGDTARGESIYVERCAGCHGQNGQGASAMELVGDRELLATEFPDRGIGVYWPYAPTLFEYIKRAMPPDQPYSLSDDEVYSVIAWLLELNGLGDPDQQSLDAAALSAVRMPNRDGFRTSSE